MFLRNRGEISAQWCVVAPGFHSLGAMLKSSPDTTPVGATPFVTHLPPLLALTTVEVAVCHGSLTARLAGFLSLIRSAPALSSVIFHDLYPGDAGDIVDDTLAQLAMQVKAKRSLTVVLEGWMGESIKWKEYFPKFRKTGGQVVMNEIL